MKLAERCSDSFDREIQRGGQACHQAGSVNVEWIDEELASALVAGSQTQPYEVDIDFEDYKGGGFLLATCTCPHFRTVGLCKHIWAVLLDLDSADVGIPEADRWPIPVIADDDSSANPYRWEGESDDDWLDDLPGMRRVLPFSPSNPARRTPNWRVHLQQVAWREKTAEEAFKNVWDKASGKRRELWYLLEENASRYERALMVSLFRRETKKNGELGKPKAFTATSESVASLSFDQDRKILNILGRGISASFEAFRYFHSSYLSRINISPSLYETLLPDLCATGRFRRQQPGDESFDEAIPLAWDDGSPYRFRIAVEVDEANRRWLLRGQLCRDEERISLADPLLVLQSGIVLFADRLARLDAGKHAGWLTLFEKEAEIAIPYEDRDEFLETLFRQSSAPEIDLPSELDLSELTLPPKPILRISKPEKGRKTRDLVASLILDYGGALVAINDPRSRILARKEGKIIVRDGVKEEQLLARLAAWNASLYESRRHGAEATVSFLASRLPEIVATLTSEGWVVEAEGFRIRQPGEFSGGVSSGIDWFELDGSFDYGNGVVATLPDLLEAVRHDQDYVQLSDGSQGILPARWLAKFGSLAEMGQAEDGKLRFGKSQAMLLDALLAAQENVHVDKQFAELRDRLQSFRGITPSKEPRGFSGQLRDYQRQGLGWLEFLDTFGLGGCLADDMGLGKTIQVLAMLQRRRTAGKTKAPSMIVVPRSLVANWIEEAARFSPRVRFRDYTGLKRRTQLAEITPGDVLVTTYGTVRRDVLKLKEIEFDYVILDEAQAIKNANSQSAKAVRLLPACRRLALTGTPVENHLGELWSLFEFLNPGMLGRSSVFQKCWKNGQAEDDKLELLRAALAPFILRRTKAQVLRELPEKTEQTLYCELGRQERKAYDQLRKYYRDLLQKKIEERGLNQAKIHVLEALLRLRQAACHRGLLDRKHKKEASAKLETLLEQVAEITDEGHKVLVFSQFTTLLSIVRDQFDQRGIVCEYLDGKTRNRAEKVKRFQADPDCRVFLISLRAGGHGLNLTAADYVFILDPWWNPAVEAQAIDRTHRIGQTRPVFAYRLIARDTVEEKIMQLQETKRNLADAIIAADGSVMQRLTPEDLQLLLG